jgi:V8-like Glu-specific endopeptidase
MNTYPGHSGSPIIRKDKIIGVHNGAGSTFEAFNLGRFVDSSLAQNIIIWSN